jgi:hypothetical protein
MEAPVTELGGPPKAGGGKLGLHLQLRMWVVGYSHTDEANQVKWPKHKTQNIIGDISWLHTLTN